MVPLGWQQGVDPPIAPDAYAKRVVLPLPFPDAAINHPESFHYPELRDGVDILEDDQQALPTCDAGLPLSFLESSRRLLRVETATVQGQ